MSRHPARCLICMDTPLTAPPRVLALQVLLRPRCTSPPHARSAARFRGRGPKERRGALPPRSRWGKGAPAAPRAGSPELPGGSRTAPGQLPAPLPACPRKESDRHTERMLRALFIPSPHMASQTPGHRAPRDTDPPSTQSPPTLASAEALAQAPPPRSGGLGFPALGAPQQEGQGQGDGSQDPTEKQHRECPLRGSSSECRCPPPRPRCSGSGLRGEGGPVLQALTSRRHL